MTKLYFLVGLTILAAFASAQQAPCPLQTEIGSLVSGKFHLTQLA